MQVCGCFSEERMAERDCRVASLLAMTVGTSNRGSAMTMETSSRGSAMTVGTSNRGSAITMETSSRDTQ
jgi:hypothetical protein